MSVTDVGASKRLKALFTKIRRELPETLEMAAEELCMVARSHTPTIAEEYMVMMTGYGNPEGITNMPMAPSSDITDMNADNRMRFYKPDGTWLEQVVGRSRIVDANNLSIHLGSISLLNLSSIYYWRNVGRNASGAVYSCQAPFWEAWEDGMFGTFEISTMSKSGNIAMLTPGVGKENHRYAMYKEIPACHMYALTHAYIPTLFDESIEPAIRKIAQGA
jgi:hypothetical protein